MSIQIEFKRADDRVAEYAVNIDGHSAVAKGRGASGRSLAYAALDHFRKLKAEKEKYAASLDAMAKCAMHTAAFTVEEAENEELYLG